MCGVCHTDLHTVEGELSLPDLPLTPGHQVVGVVDSLGEGVSRHQPGDRAGVAWLNWTCGQCFECRSGLENLCSQVRFTGLHEDGGYAEYLVVDERFAFALPDIFSDAEAAPLLCAGITFTPAGWIIPLALGHLQPGGTLAINAIHLSPIPEIPYHLIYGERTLRSVANFTRHDAEEFLRLASEIPIRSSVEIYPLEKANTVLQRLKASQIRGAAVLQI